MQRALAGVLIVVALIANVVGTYLTLTRPYPGLNDYMSRWEAARSFFVDGLNPYGDEATLNIQTRIYGRAAADGEDLGLFAYPFYTVFVVGPLVYLPYAWASAVWMVLLEVCLIAGLLLLLDVVRWRPSPLMLAALMIFALLNYYALRGLILGQPSHVVYALTALALWGLSKERDVVAGAALALSTIKPQMGYLIVPFLLLWGLRAGRWRFVGAFSVAFGGLMLASFALVPTWLFDWLGQVQQYPTYTRDGALHWIFSEVWLGLSPPVSTIIGYAITIPLVVWLLWTWYGVLVQRRDERLLWAVAVTLLVTHAVAPRTATPHYVVFTLVLLMVLKRLNPVWNILILLMLLVVPWVHFTQTVISPNLENLTVFLPLPPLVLLALVLTRRAWWNQAPPAIAA